MSKHEPVNEQISNGINLLISILIRYPEIGTISFDPEHKWLKLVFMLSAIPSELDFSNTKQLLMDSIVAYNKLEGLSLETSDIQLYTHDQIAMLSIVRDVHTISNNEISLIITLLQENLTNYLIVEYNDSLAEEDLLMQEEIIEDLLLIIKYHHVPHGLIGIRENGKILVFNK